MDSGSDGHSWYISPEITGPELIITFDQEVLGALPTIAGLVWTDGNPNAVVTVTALGIEGETLGELTLTIGDGIHDGSTAADRFMGAQFSQGIYQLVITASVGGLEIDHVQMGFEGVIIPLPPALALGVAGLGLVAVRRRRSKNA